MAPKRNRDESALIRAFVAEKEHQNQKPTLLQPNQNRTDLYSVTSPPLIGVFVAGKERQITRTYSSTTRLPPLRFLLTKLFKKNFEASKQMFGTHFEKLTPIGSK